MLLDLEDPTKVIGRLRHSFLKPTEEERDGYVPNVVYSTEGRKRIARTANGSSGFFSSLMGAFGLDRLFGRARDRTFDAVPSRERRTKPAKPKSWFQRLFGTGRGSGD